MSTIFERVNIGLKQNKQVRLSGDYNCIPWTLPRFSKIIPGIEKAKIYGVTASSKVGKTQITDFLFMHQPYNFIKTAQTNIKLKIFYFSLEISKEAKIRQTISHKLFLDKGLQYSPQQLQSIFQDYTLDDQTEQLIDQYGNWFSEFEETVTFIDNIRNPFGIYNYMRNYALNNGKIHYKTININGKDVQVEDYYEPNDPNEYVIVIIDHISLITPEKGSNLHESMSKLSSEYCLSLRDRFKYSVVLVQQQSSEKEKLEFNNGKKIEEKILPSADGLGDNKLVGRDLDLLLGLFAPYRYKIPVWDGYDIRKLGDNYRELSVLLNRQGTGFISLPLYFNGAVNFFKELPYPEHMTEEIYENIRKGLIRNEY